MSNGVEFDEEKSYVDVRNVEKEFPENGIEGFIYKKIPGKYSSKKNILILTIILIFALSFLFFILGLKNLGENDDNNFGDRINNTRLK